MALMKYTNKALLDNVIVGLTTKGESYAAAGIIWNESLHPRDHNGHFKHKAGGVFKFLKDVSKGSYNSGVYHGEGGYHPGVNEDIKDVEPGHKIGGVEIHAPTEHGYAAKKVTVDYKLAPGESVHPITHGPYDSLGGNAVLQKMADGSGVVLMPTHEDELPKIGAKNPHASELQAQLENSGYQIGEAIDHNDYNQSAKEVEAAKKVGAAPQSDYGVLPGDKITDASILDKLPVGSVVKTPHADHKKFDNNKWDQSNASEGHFTSKAFTNIAGANNLSLKSLPKEEAKDDKPTPKLDKLVSEPSAPKPHATNPFGTPKPTTPSNQHDITDESGKKIGHVIKEDTGQHSAYDAKGNKLGYSAKHMHSAVAKVHAANTPQSDSKPVEKTLEPTPTPKVETPSTPATDAPKGHTIITDSKGKKIGHVEKIAEGKYQGKFTAHDEHGNKVGNVNKHMDSAIAKVHENHAAQKATVNDALGIKPAEEKVGLKPGDSISTEAHVESLPAGSVINVSSSINNLTKQESGGWKLGVGGMTHSNNVIMQSLSKDAKVVSIPGEPEPLADWEKELLGDGLKPDLPLNDDYKPEHGDYQDIAGKNGAHLGHLEKVDGKWAPYNAKGDKLGYATKNYNTALGKVQALDGQSFHDAQPTKEVKAEGVGTYDLKPGEKIVDVTGSGVSSWYAKVADEKVVALVGSPHNVTPGMETTANSAWQDHYDVNKASNVIIAENPASNAVPTEASIAALDNPVGPPVIEGKPVTEIWKNTYGGDEHHFHPDGTSTIVQFGHLNMSVPGSTTSVNLKYFKSGNAPAWKKVADIPANKIPEVKPESKVKKTKKAVGKLEYAIPSVTPSIEYDSAGYSYGGDSNTLLGAANYWKSNLGNGVSLHYSTIGNDATGQGLVQAHSNLSAGKVKYYEGMGKGEKGKLNKALKKIEETYALHLMAKKLENGESLTADDESKLAEIKTNNQKKGNTDYVVTNILTSFNSKIKAAKWSQAQGNLGFNPLSGTDEDYKKYATENGAQFINGMSSQDLKNWTLSKLGEPSYSGPSASSIEESAKQSVKMHAVAAKAKDVTALKEALKKTKLEEQAEKAKVAKLAKTHDANVAEAKSVESFYVTHPNNGGYDIPLEPNTVVLKNPSEPGQMWLVTPTHQIYVSMYDESAENALSSQAPHGTTQEAQLATLKEAYPDFVEVTPKSTKPSTDTVTGTQYITHAKGYQIPVKPGEIVLSKAAGNGTENYRIMVLNDEGRKYYSPFTSSVDDVSWVPWYELADNKNNFTQNAIEQGYKNITPNWEGQQAPGVVSGPQEVTIPGSGEKITVPEGTLVSVYSGKKDIMVFAPEGYKSYVSTAGSYNNKTFIPYNEYSDQKDAASYHAYALGVGHTDLSPKWGQNASAATQAKLSSDKPNNIDQNIWDFVTGAEHADPKDLYDYIGEPYASFTSEELGSKIASASFSGNLTNASLEHAPDSIKKLALYASAMYYGNSYGPKETEGSNLMATLAAKAKANEYVHPDAEEHTLPSGSKVTLAPGSKVFKYGNKYIVLTNDGKTGYQMASGGQVQYAIDPDDYTGYTSADPVINIPDLLTYSKAKLEGQTFTPEALQAVDDVEPQAAWNNNDIPEAASAYYFKNALDKIDGGEKYSGLTKKLYNLPVGVKQLAYESAMHQNTDTLDAISWKFAKGAYVNEPTVAEHELVNPTASYAEQVAKGIVDSDGINDTWQSKQVNDFITDYSLPVSPYASFDEKAQAIAAKLADLKAETPMLPKPADPTKDTAALQLTPTPKQLGGMHSKQHYVDQLGDEWMGKFYSSDPNAGYRVDAEHYANVMGRLFGFSSPQTFVRDLNGNYSYVQNLAPSDGNLDGYAPTDLNESQLSAAMKEHVLDWLVGNHDSHPQNLLRTPDGKSVFGIDKGQAFKHIHDDRLAVGYLPPENPVPVWYDQFYNGIANKNVTEQVANHVATQTLLKAYQVQSQYDERFKSLLEAALEKRDFWPDKYPTKADFVQAVMDRKANLLSDFEKLYKKQFAKAGYDWKIDTSNFGKKVGDAHVQNNPQFASEVKDANSHGIALMQDSPDLEDAHAMFTPVQQKSGGTMLTMNAKLREAADKIVSKFLATKVEGGVTSTGYDAQDEEVTPPNESMYNLAEFHALNVAMAKTLSTHDSDKAYNMNVVTGTANYAQKVQNTVSAVKKHRMEAPTKVWSDPDGEFNFNTLEQQDAYVQNAEKKLMEYGLIKSAYDQKKKLSDAHPGTPNFEPISYTATKGIDTNDKAKPAEGFNLPSGGSIVKTSDGGHYMIDVDGNEDWISHQEYANLSTSAGAVKTAVDGKKQPKWVHDPTGDYWEKESDGKWYAHVKGQKSSTGHSEDFATKQMAKFPAGQWTFKGDEAAAQNQPITQDVQVAGKNFKVTLRNSAVHGGTLDPKTGKMVESKTKTDDFQSGNEYVIEYGNTKLYYRPWNGQGVNKSQQGLLTAEVKNWDGGHETIDDLLDSMHLLGVNVTPSDSEALELHYWRHLLSVSQSNSDASKYSKLADAMKKATAQNPNMSKSEELTALRAAWADQIGQDKVDNAPWQPQFSKNYDQVSGRPHWIRPDYSISELKKQYGDKIPLHKMYGANSSQDQVDRTVSILKNAKLLPTEERIRVYGKAIGGWSSSGDQSYGSSAFVFTRQNVEPYNTSGNIHFMLDPSSALRTTNYALSSDSMGAIENKKTDATFNPKTMYGLSASDNELMIKNEAPIVAAIVPANIKQQIIAGLGVDNINGIPIDEILYTSSEWSAKYKNRIEAVWKKLLEEEKKYTKGGN